MQACDSFLESSLKLFRYYKHLGDQTLARLDEDELHRRPDAHSNSAAIIVKHLWGNMRSRWTDFLTSDGEKPWRQRDAEFEDDIADKAQLMQLWEEGWQCLFEALEPLRTDDLSRIVHIRNEGHTVLEAIQRQLAHYAYHVGQLVYLGKHLEGEAWASLSIPKGQSADYNRQKMKNGPRRGHFSDEFLKGDE